MKRLIKTTTAKVTLGFVLGASAVGGAASAAGVFGGNVTTACVDNRTNAIYASSNGSCPATRTAVTLGAPATTTSNSAALPAVTSIKAIVAKVSPSVVTVNVTASSGGDTGSGSIYKSDANSSYIVTNNHVIAAATNGAGTIDVELDNGDSVPATIVGSDSNYDLAVLKINRGNQPAIQIGNSATLSIGDSVIAFGSPLGLDHTVTAGIVSSLNRPVTTGTTGSESYVDAIQTDAAINPGNSGGPLTDSLGRMVGINSAIATLGSSIGGQSGSIGVGFSIPITEAQRVINEIISTGKSTKPVLGVYFDTTYTGKGAKISGLTTNDGAQNAGIPSGSIVTAIDGIKVPDSVTAIVRIRSHAPGDTVSVTVTLPTGGSKTFSVVLGSAASS
jgi:putative serine protease PepD